MTATSAARTGPVRQIAVLRAQDITVTHGVNEGDPLSDAADLSIEDIYELAPGAAPERLALAFDGKGGFRIGDDSPLGRASAPIFLDALATFMSPDSTTHEALILVETDPQSATIAEIYLFPLAEMAPHVPYALVSLSRQALRETLAETAAVSFTRGTHITLASGAQVKIEDLRPGDRVLTRDSGPQEVRWIGEQTLRATGAFAPIVIAPGALNNANELVVSPNHRLFIYQRRDDFGAGQKEILVKASLLVNGTSVTTAPGGFVDYFQVLFDKHEIIYAEGIAAESFFIDETTRPALPQGVTAKLREASGNALPARELRETDLAARPDPVAMLKRLSTL